MSLDARDEARLRRIEAELAAADPVLVGWFRKWQPAGGPESPAPSWSAAPPWVLLVFLVGFGTWAVAPAFGVAITLGVAYRMARQRARGRSGTGVAGRGVAGRGQGTS